MYVPMVVFSMLRRMAHSFSAGMNPAFQPRRLSRSHPMVSDQPAHVEATTHRDEHREGLIQKTRNAGISGKP